MSSKDQAVIVIIAVAGILLFLGILFLVMTLYYANKRKQMQREKQAMMEEFNRQILESKLEMQEQTFSFISQEIHDNVGQMLSVAKVQLALLDEGREFNQELIRESKQSVSMAMGELRDLARSLNTDRIQQFDLPRSVEEQVHRISKAGIRVDMDVVGPMNGITDSQKLILFRVIQESLQNMVKHSGADTINIRMVGSPSNLQVVLRDNGAGFNVDKVMQEQKGLGLANMQKRIALIGGCIAFDSKPGEGTIVSINIKHA
jgi:signal transduction histidine kinase